MSSKKKVVVIKISEKEKEYLSELLDEEVFKLQGVVKVVDKSSFKQVLEVAEDLKKKVFSSEVSVAV